MRPGPNPAQYIGQESFENETAFTRLVPRVGQPATDLRFFSPGPLLSTAVNDADRRPDSSKRLTNYTTDGVGDASDISRREVSETLTVMRTIACM